MYPIRRNRRLRTTEILRSLIRETYVAPNDFLVPLFIVEGKGIKEEIDSMPNYFRYSLDLLKIEVRELFSMGLRSVLLFVKVDDKLKDNEGVEALNEDGLMQRAIKTIKDTCPDMLIMTDVALDPYSSFGHDGIVLNGIINNEQTNTVLSKMAVSHAQAGADLVAPSDMMDGRVLRIRDALDLEGLIQTGIMSYSAKYASNFYGPFRDALDSAPVDMRDVPKDKSSYQMDYSNRHEAVKETMMDVKEGADIVMVKPGLCYLDIVRDIKNSINIPLAVYQVSGEYAMLKAASERGWLNHDAVMMEQITAIKRAGADIIASYFAKDVIRVLG